MNSRQIKLFVVFGLSISLGSHAAEELTCVQELAFEGFAREIHLALEKDESPSSPVILLPGRRVAVGTSVLGPADSSGGRSVTGGRLLVHDLAHDEPLVALETPTTEGKPTRMGEVVHSRDGRFLAATGGYLFGGPVLSFEMEPSVRFLRSVQVTVNRAEETLDRLLELLETAYQGSIEAKQTLSRFDYDGRLLRAYQQDPESTKSYLRELMLSQQEPSEPIPAMGVDFHPNGGSYLINAGVVSIRDSLSGNELRRHALNPPSHIEILDPPHYYFLGKGQFVVGVSRVYLTLWDANTGTLLDVQRHDGEIGRDATFIHLAPDRTTLSYWVKTPRGPTRQIWSTELQGEKTKLVKIAESVLPSDEKRAAPAVALADNQTHALSGVDGVVEVFRDGKKVSTIAGGPSRDVKDLALSKSADWLTIIGRDANGEFLEVWALKNPRGVRLRLSPATDGRTRNLHSPSFSLDGGWLGFSMFDVSADNRDWTTTPYAVDIYNLMATVRP